MNRIRRSSMTIAALSMAGAFGFGIAFADGEGEQISPQMAIHVLPYAEISQDAYNSDSQLSKTDLGGRWQRIGDWQSELKAHNFSAASIKKAQNRGFYAAIYKDTWTGDIVVSYRGTRDTRGLNPHDFVTDIELKFGRSRPGPAEAASQLATFIKKDYPNSRITLTGHSLGGYWATYAGEKAGITNVVTFNSARGPAISNYKNPGQINIVVSGELIGDPNTGNWLGSGRLPGKLYGVDSIFGSPNLAGDFGSHGVEGIINGLNLQALKAPLPKSALGASSTPHANVQASASTPNMPTPVPSGTPTPAAKPPIDDIGPVSRPAAPKRDAKIQRASANPDGAQNPTRGVQLNPDLYTSKRDLLPPKPIPEPQYKAPPQMHAPVTGFGTQSNARPSVAPSPSYAPAPSSYVALRAPGGISISKAAAERIPIGFDIEASYLKDGPLILSGRKESTGSIDAAILLTAFRAACEPTDPYFSLDADGIGWVEESSKARTELISRIRGDLYISKLTPTSPVGTTYRTVSARRDYPAIWAQISARYPHLRSKLVFRPDWLAQTRFGEILYKGDVLLKELAGGSPVFKDAFVKANRVDGYSSYSMRVVSKGLQNARAGLMQAGRSRQSRLWFDLISAEEKKTLNDAPKVERIALANNSTRKVIQDGSALDFSSIYPRMFVKPHDLASGSDLDIPQPEMDALSSQVNSRIKEYTAQYPELQRLTQVFRAYIVAAHVTKQDPALCKRIASIPLTDSEKVGAPLPEYHPSELFITVGRSVVAYAKKTVRGRRALQSSSGLMQGGVSIAAKALMELGVVHVGTTPLLATVVADIEQRPAGEKPRVSDRSYLALDLFDKTPAAAAASEKRSELQIGSPPAGNAPRISVDPPPAAGPPGGPLHPVAPTTPPVWKTEISPPQSPPPRPVAPAAPVPNARGVGGSAGAGASLFNSPAGVILISLILVILAVSLLAVFLGKSRRQGSKADSSARHYDAKGRYPSGAWAMPDLSEKPAPQPRTQTSARRTLDRHAQSNQPKPYPSKLEVRFRNAFFSKTHKQQEEMIAHWRGKLNCSREDAIDRLLSDLDKDNRAWRA